MAIKVHHEVRIECDFCHLTGLVTSWKGTDPDDVPLFIKKGRELNIDLVDWPAGWGQVDIRFSDNGETVTYVACRECIPKPEEAF